jgi:NitT/TauT family transport system substrate-binding protein
MRETLVKSFSAVGLTLMMLIPQAVRAESIAVSNWGSGMLGVPYAVAMKQKFFEQAGIDIDQISGGGGGTVLRNAMASSLPYGEVAPSAAVAAYREGLHVIIVATGTIVVNNVWLVPPNSPIKTLKDFSGKRVAYTSPKSISEALLLMVLAQEHIDEHAITRIASGGYVQGLTLLTQNAVDVAPLSEPLLSLNAGKYRIVAKAQDVLPEMVETVGVTTREFATQHPDKIRAIIAGRRMAVDYIYAHPEEAGRIAAGYNDMDPEIVGRAVKSNAEGRQWVTGEIKRVQYDHLADGLRLTGELVGEAPWAALLDPSFLPDDLKAKSN